MLKKLKSFVIDRNVWLRGGFEKNKIISVLFDEQSEKMCCLGIYCAKSGVNKNDLIGQIRPFNVKWNIFKWNNFSNYKNKKINIPSWLVSTNKKDDSLIATQLMNINDDINITEKERETIVKVLFATKVSRLRFEDNYGK